MSKVLVYGGNGALGRVISVATIDGRSSDIADKSITIDFKADINSQFEQISKDLTSWLSDSKLDAIINVAGGFGGAFLSTTTLMLNQSVNSSLISAHLGSQFLKSNGLIVLTGAAAVINPKNPVSFAVGYGLAKAAVHQLVASLADPSGGLPEGSKAVAISPRMLDTPANREAMPGSDFSSWTPLEDVASSLKLWIEDASKVENGKIYEVVTEAGKTTFQ